MHRIDQDGHVDNRFVEGDPETGQLATRVGAEWLNAVQEEICNAITGRGVTLEKDDNTQLSDCLTGFDERLDAIEKYVGADGEWTYPAAKTRSVLVPLEMALPYAIGGAETNWAYGFDSAFSSTQRIWMGSGTDDILQIPLGHLLPSGGTPSRIEVLLKPRGARSTVSDRLLVELVRQTHSFGVGTANIPTSATVASGRDDGTESLQVLALTLTSQPAHDRNIHALFLRIVPGVVTGTRDDAIVGVRLVYLDPGPRNA